MLPELAQDAISNDRLGSQNLVDISERADQSAGRPCLVALHRSMGPSGPCRGTSVVPLEATRAGPQSRSPLGTDRHCQSSSLPSVLHTSELCAPEYPLACLQSVWHTFHVNC